MKKYRLNYDWSGEKKGKILEYTHIYWDEEDIDLLLRSGALTEIKEKIEIVPSGRIDYCCMCKSNHGYDCPLDSEVKKIEKLIDYWKEFEETSNSPIERLMTLKINELVEIINTKLK